MADILSVIAMTQSTDEEIGIRGTLKYRLVGLQKPVGDWGHEYVRHLAMEVINESAQGAELPSNIVKLTEEIVSFFLDHNCEPDACDLLFEVGMLPVLVDLVTKDGRDHERVCRYLLSCLPYEADLDDRAALEVTHRIYLKMGDYPNALLSAMRLNDLEMIASDFYSCPEPVIQKQLAYLLARQRVTPIGKDKEPSEELKNILNNTFLTDHYQSLGKDLEIEAPKTPEDIYKSHLQDTLRVSVAPSPRQNLASAFVNAFVNAGFGTDKLVTCAEIEADESKSWIYKTKDHGVLSTVASIGLINLWNADSGLGKLDRYLYSENINIKSGAILGIGLVHAGTKNESDPALALLREYIESSGEGTTDVLTKTVALIGLALAYGGSGREDVIEPVLPLIGGHSSIQVAAMAALTVGHVFVGSCNGDLASAILQTLMERDGQDLDQPVARFLALALALLYLGKTEEEAEVILETLQAIQHPIAKDASTLVKICSYAGSGNVLKIQELLRICTLPTEGESNKSVDRDVAKGGDGDVAKNDTKNVVGKDVVTKDCNFQTFAVIGIALICMMEDVGKEMSHRLFSHLMHYGSPSVRKAVPLALGLLYTSHPAVTVMDLLSKYSHDHDKAVAVNAIFSMGLIAAGTNNAKMAQMLRQLAAYYQRDVDCLYVVRIAQGLVHAGKGTVTMSPIHSHRFLINPAAFAGLFTTVMAFTDAQPLLMENTSYLLYFLVTAMYPRFVVTLDESLNPLKTLMRVGQAVDVVGQAGKPKTITGFQTHTTPVLLAYQERAEMATEEYLPVSPVLESFVIVRKNPDWRDGV